MKRLVKSRLTLFLVGMLFGGVAFGVTGLRDYSTQQATNILAQGFADDQSSITIFAGDTDLDSIFYTGGASGKWSIYASGDTCSFRFHEDGGDWTTTRISGSMTLLDGETYSTNGIVVDSVRIIRPSSSVEATWKGTRYDGS
jgi:hypothetical protein